MLAQDINTYASPPFKFIINITPIYIHTKLIAQHSKPLERMMNGAMKEAQQGAATLKEINEGTFARFVKWAYVGFYTAAEHSDGKEEGEKMNKGEAGGGQMTGVEVGGKQVDGISSFIYDDALPEASPFDQVSTTEFDQGWGQVYKRPSKNKYAVAKGLSHSSQGRSQSQTQQALKESFLKRQTSVRQTSITIPTPRPNQSPSENYTEPFLSHARLYVFADQYDIQPLKLLALEELQTLLSIFTLYEQRTGDIITLMRYIYANTGEPRAGVEDLSTLMTHYMGFEMGTLMKDEGFVRLLVEDGAAMMRDFTRMVGKRI